MRDTGEQHVDRKLTELYLSNLPFRRIMDTLPTPAYICDAHGLITYFNQKAAQAWGRAPALNEPKDRFCGSVELFDLDGSPVPRDQCWMAQALRQDKECQGEEIVIRPDGQHVTLSVHASPIHDESGTLLGAVAVLLDITEQQQTRRILELLATGSSLTDVLTPLVQLIEARNDGLTASITVRQPDGYRFYTCVAPSMPTRFGYVLGRASVSPPYFAPCSQAVHLGEEVVTNDLMSDQRFSEQWRDLSEDVGLHTCYSTPIHSADDRTLGSLAVFYREERNPKALDKHLLQTVARLAGIAIERKQDQEVRRKRELEHILGRRVSRERQRISRELHDGFRQQLLGMGTLSAALRTKMEARGDPEAEQMREFSDLLQHANDHLRQLIYDLTPVTVDFDSLIPALQQQCAQIERRYTVSCDVEAHFGEARIPDEAANCMFHIAREALTNAARHSQAQEIQVFVRTLGSRFALEIRDNGGGIPANLQHAESPGLNSMRYWAELAGATLTIGGHRGTTIVCTLDSDA